MTTPTSRMVDPWREITFRTASTALPGEIAQKEKSRYDEVRKLKRVYCMGGYRQGCHAVKHMRYPVTSETAQQALVPPGRCAAITLRRGSTPTVRTTYSPPRLKLPNANLLCFHFVRKGGQITTTKTSGVTLTQYAFHPNKNLASFFSAQLR